MPYTPEELAEHRSMWVCALRSEQYEQATGHLSVVGVGMCCIGVACDLAAKAGVEVARRVTTVETRGSSILTPGPEVEAFDDETEVCPPVVRDWLGLRSPTGELPYSEGEYDSLTIRNDRGESFRQIADAIETHADVLFHPASTR